MSKDKPSNKKLTKEESEIIEQSGDALIKEFNEGKQVETEKPFDISEAIDTQEKAAFIRQQSQKHGTIINVLLEMLRSTEKVIFPDDRGDENNLIKTEVSTFKNEQREALQEDLYAEYLKLKSLLN